MTVHLPSHGDSAANAPELNPIVAMDACTLSKAIHNRSVSCVEVMVAYLDHIDRFNPAVNAIVSMRPHSDLLRESEDKDRALAAGDDGGWMHGFPHAVKDTADVAGLKTTMGFFRVPFDVPPATTDSIHIARIRAAGAIFIGKTNIPEFGLGSHSYNNVFGTTLNAYDTTRSAGGSSGGAASALALRMLPVADGSDFMGSLRNPAGWNNIFGFRPSFGRVPTRGTEVFVQHGAVDGPMARTATDLAVLLQTMSGRHDAAPMSLASSLNTAGLERDFTGTRLAWMGDLGGYLPMEPGVLDVCDSALPELEKIGIDVVEHPGLPTSNGFNGNDDLWPLWLTFRHWLVGGPLSPLYREPTLAAALKPEAKFEVEGLLYGRNGNSATSALDIYEASTKRTAMYNAFLTLFETVDFIALPTAQVFPFDAETDWPREVNGVSMSSYHRWMEVTTIATLLGVPAISVPAGFSNSGLPMGIQILGRPHADYSLLQLARSWEQQTSWSSALPNLLR